LAGKGDRSFLFSYLEGRFGISRDNFDDCLLFKKRKNWWILKESPLIGQITHLKVWRVGFKAFQEVGQFVKPTTRMIQLFGPRATRARLDISEGDFRRLARSDEIRADMGIDNGYVILSIKGMVLGLGLLINGAIRSQIPKKEIRFFVLT
jgi:NOL1/NOP2/fmu family ribosome biogenesis protein